MEPEFVFLRGKLKDIEKLWNSYSWERYVSILEICLRGTYRLKDGS